MSHMNDLGKVIHQVNKSKGFYDDPKNIGEMIALIHSEASEMLEADRKDRYSESLVPQSVAIQENNFNFKQMFESEVKDTFEDELADVIIRCLDMAAYKNIDIDTHVAIKLRYNSLRPHKHGKKY